MVFADPLRWKIVTELVRCEMSPSQFQAAYGGGSLSRIDHHFKRLAESGWLRLVRKKTGGRRRGSTENFYRAPEPAVFDNETWAKLPGSLRAEFSWRSFEQFAERVKTAFEAETLDSRSDRSLTWTPLTLDSQAREWVLRRVDSLFGSLFEEQADARVRIVETGEQPIHLTIGLGAFDSPRADRNRSGLRLPAADEQERLRSLHYPVRMAKVFGNAVNLKIVAELNQRAMSPSQFVEEAEGTAISDVYRRFQALARSGWLVKVGESTGGRRRGATEHFYRATTPALCDTRDWSRVSAGRRGGSSWRTFEQLAEQVREAIEAGTFDSRTDRHHTWTPLTVDETGWRQVIASMDALFRDLFREEAAAKVRLAESGERPVYGTVHLVAFESPAPSGKAIAEAMGF